MAKKKVETVEKCEEKYAGHKGKFPGMEVKTPYPDKVKPNEITYLGNKLADLSERINEVELSVSDLTIKLKIVLGRMGL